MNMVKKTKNGARDGNGNIGYVPNADVISIETIVNMMVSKGICTADELFMLQGQVQELNQDDKKNNFLNIQNHYDRGRHPALKRAMSKHNWSRRIGTAIFGWKWKKVKKN